MHRTRQTAAFALITAAVLSLTARARGAPAVSRTGAGSAGQAGVSGCG
ncbi:hypothetical protein AB0D35_22355 [Streptomyces sp. NPDC048301]